MTDFPFTADLVLLNSGETNRKGMYVELGLHHEIDGPIRPGDRNPFMDLKQGREQGQRFRVTFHLLADDETTTAEQEKGGPLSQEAGRLCAKADFRLWLRRTATGVWASAYETNNVTEEDTAAEVVRRICHVHSRARIDDEAADTWKAIAKRYYDSQQGRSEPALLDQRDRRQG